MSGRPRPQTELCITIRLSAATFMFGGATANRRLEEIEARLHNPKAEVVYDILAQQGGAQLYSQISFLSAVAGAESSDYPPPQGSRERLAALEAQVAALSSEVQGLRTNEIAQLEAALNAKGVPRILLPH